MLLFDTRGISYLFGLYCVTRVRYDGYLVKPSFLIR